MVFIKWGSNPGQPYIGVAPTSMGSFHGKVGLRSRAQRWQMKAAGPLAQLLAIPQDGGDDGDDDPLAALKADIAGARGRAMLVETTAAGWGEGKTAAPQADWRQQRLGPAPPEVMAQLRRDAFEHVLAACGTPPSLFTDRDGTSQREAVRRWHLNLVLPLARMVERMSCRRSSSRRCGSASTATRKDMVSRAQVFAKLIAAEGMTVEKALEIAGLVDRRMTVRPTFGAVVAPKSKSAKWPICPDCGRPRADIEIGGFPVTRL